MALMEGAALLASKDYVMRKINIVGSLLLAALCSTAYAEGLVESPGAVDDKGGESGDDVDLEATCEIHIGTTYRSGSTIVGYGSQANCGTNGRSTLTIQRSRWYGWEDLVSIPVIGSGHNVYVRYNCAGTGTHDFRTIHTGRTVGGAPLFKGSNVIRVSC